ncbi:PEPxxWA-CTERM sorting domain-containing protein [Phenylobacterium sp.]|uniref:PEPxxWA-CTERM sorting domain-containing protein n=1 Tax=Phenylobacterium sp. TaxID=1871053 RepID=UPI0025D0DB65|nr:PEPxxWA-CTERM sorting domain-containing protein [Phenylobacterium sp.]
MRLPALTALALAIGVASGAQAANLIQNGSFNTLNPAGANAPPSASGIEVDGAFGDAGAVTGWTSAGGTAYNIYFYGNGSEAGGLTGVDAANRWGENGQRPNVNFTGDSPDGGAYMVLDADPGFSGAFSQSVGGLTVGQEYDLSFYWAGGELYDRTGYQTSQLTGTFGTSSFATSVFTNSHPGCNGCVPPGDFSGWQLVNFDFVAQTTTQTLSFLAVGTPVGNLPPVAFLDGVSLVAVPEPAAWTLMLLGFGGLGVAIRRRRRLAAA